MKSILVVDDDPVIAEAIRLVAEQSDLMVQVCDSLDAVKDCYEALHPNFIILDLHLRGSDADDVLAYLAGRSHVPPILLISGLGIERLDLISKGGLLMELPIHSIREKPLNFRHLKEIFESLKQDKIKTAQTWPPLKV